MSTRSEQERRKWTPRWDDEEILRGHRRKADGTFPSFAKIDKRGLERFHPNDEHAERVRNILEQGRDLVHDNLKLAIETLATILQDPDANEGAKVAASRLIMEYCFGKAPQTVNITGATPFERLMLGIVLEFTGGETPQVIDTDGVETTADGIIWDDEEDIE